MITAPQQRRAAPGKGPARATPFISRTHRNAHHRSTHAHCLRVARRRQQERRQRRQQDDRRHRCRRTADRLPLRARPGHQELRRPRDQEREQEQRGPRHRVQDRGPRRPGRPDLRPGQRHQARRQQGRHRRRRPAELRRRPVDAGRLPEGRRRPGLPANTNPALSQGDDWATGDAKRPFTSYFRTCATDTVQGKFAAQYLFNDAKKKAVYVVDDKQTYGAGLAAIFAEEFKRLGGKVVGTDHITVKETDFSSTADKVKASKADSVYFGGQYPEGGLLSDQIKKTGAKIPTFGGDGLYDPAFISASGEANDGDLATSVGYPVEALPTAKQFIADYNAEGYKDPYGAYGGYSYDAAWSVIQAVKAVAADNDGKLPEDARPKVIEAMSGVTFDGVTGKVAFDEFGDTTNKQLTVYEVQKGAWKDVKSATFED